MIDDMGGVGLSDEVTLIAKTIETSAADLRKMFADAFKGMDAIPIKFEIMKGSKTEIDRWLNSRTAKVKIDITNKKEVSQLLSDARKAITKTEKIELDGGVINARLSDDALLSILYDIENLVPHIANAHVGKVTTGDVTVKARFDKNQIQSALTSISRDVDKSTGEDVLQFKIPIGASNANEDTYISIKKAVGNANATIEKDPQYHFNIKLKAGDAAELIGATKKLQDYSKAVDDFYKRYNSATDKIRASADVFKVGDTINGVLADINRSDIYMEASSIFNELARISKETPMEMQVRFITNTKLVEDSIENNIQPYLDAVKKPPKLKVQLDAAGLKQNVFGEEYIFRPAVVFDSIDITREWVRVRDMATNNFPAEVTFSRSQIEDALKVTKGNEPIKIDFVAVDTTNYYSEELDRASDYIQSRIVHAVTTGFNFAVEAVGEGMSFTPRIDWEQFARDWEQGLLTLHDDMPPLRAKAILDIDEVLWQYIIDASASTHKYTLEVTPKINENDLLSLIKTKIEVEPSSESLDALVQTIQNKLNESKFTIDLEINKDSVDFIGALAPNLTNITKGIMTAVISGFKEGRDSANKIFIVTPKIWWDQFYRDWEQGIFTMEGEVSKFKTSIIPDINPEYWQDVIDLSAGNGYTLKVFPKMKEADVQDLINKEYQATVRARVKVDELALAMLRTEIQSEINQGYYKVDVDAQPKEIYFDIHDVVKAWDMDIIGGHVEEHLEPILAPFKLENVGGSKVYVKASLTDTAQTDLQDEVDKLKPVSVKTKPFVDSSWGLVIADAGLFDVGVNPILKPEVWKKAITESYDTNINPKLTKAKWKSAIYEGYETYITPIMTFDAWANSVTDEYPIKVYPRIDTNKWQDELDKTGLTLPISPRAIVDLAGKPLEVPAKLVPTEESLSDFREWLLKANTMFNKVGVTPVMTAEAWQTAITNSDTEYVVNVTPNLIKDKWEQYVTRSSHTFPVYVTPHFYADEAKAFAENLSDYMNAQIWVYPRIAYQDWNALNTVRKDFDYVLDILPRITQDSWDAAKGEFDKVTVDIVPKPIDETLWSLVMNKAYPVKINPYLPKEEWKRGVTAAYDTKIRPHIYQEEWDKMFGARRFYVHTSPLADSSEWEQKIKQQIANLTISFDAEKSAVESIYNKVKDYFSKNEIPIQFTIENNKIKGAIQVVSKDGSKVTGTTDKDGNFKPVPVADAQQRVKDINITPLEYMVEQFEELQPLLDAINESDNPEDRKRGANKLKSAYNKMADEKWDELLQSANWQYRKNRQEEAKKIFEEAQTEAQAHIPGTASGADYSAFDDEEKEHITVLEKIEALVDQMDGTIKTNVLTAIKGIKSLEVTIQKYEAAGDNTNAAVAEDLKKQLEGVTYATELTYAAQKMERGDGKQINNIDYDKLKEYIDTLEPGALKSAMMDTLSLVKNVPQGLKTEITENILKKQAQRQEAKAFHEAELRNLDIEEIKKGFAARLSTLKEDTKERKVAEDMLARLDTIPLEELDATISRLNGLIVRGRFKESEQNVKEVDNVGANQFQNQKQPINTETEEAMLDMVFLLEGYSDRYIHMEKALDNMIMLKTKGTSDKKNFYKGFDDAFSDDFFKVDTKKVKQELMDKMFEKIVNSNPEKYYNAYEQYKAESDFDLKKSKFTKAYGMYKSETNAADYFKYELGNAIREALRMNQEFPGLFDAKIDQLKQATTKEQVGKIMYEVNRRYNAEKNKVDFGESKYVKDRRDEEAKIYYNLDTDKMQKWYDKYNAATTEEDKNLYLNQMKKESNKSKIGQVISDEQLKDMQAHLATYVYPNYDLINKYKKDLSTVDNPKAVYTKVLKMADTLDKIQVMIGEFPELSRLFEKAKAAPNEEHMMEDLKEIQKTYKRLIREKDNPKERKDTFTYKFKDYVRKQIPSLISRAVKGIFNIIGGVLNKIKGAFVKIMKKALDISIKPFTKSVKMFSNAIKKAGGQSKVLSSISELLITPLVLAVEYTLLPVLVKLIPHIKEVITWVVQSKDKFELLGKGISNIVNSLYKMVSGNFILGFENFFKKLEDNRTPIESFYDSFTTLFTDLKNNGITVDTLSDNLTGLHTTVQNINEAFKDFGKNEDGKLTFITDFATEMATAVGETVSTTLSGIAGYLQNAETKSAIQTLMKDVVTYVLENFEITTDMISGLLDSLYKAIDEILKDDKTGGKLDNVVTNVTEIITGILDIAKRVVGDSKVVSAVWDLIWAASGIWGPILLTKALGTLMSKGAEYGAGTLIGKMGSKKSGSIPGTTGGIAGGLGGAAAGGGIATTIGKVIKEKIDDVSTFLKTKFPDIFNKGVKPVAASNTVKSPWDFAKVGEGFTKVSSGASRVLTVLSKLGGAIATITAPISAEMWGQDYTKDYAAELTYAMNNELFDTQSIVERLLSGERIRIANDYFGDQYGRWFKEGVTDKDTEILNKILANTDVYTNQINPIEWFNHERYLDINIPELQELLKEYGYDSELNTTANNIYNKIPDTQPNVTLTSNTDIVVNVDKNGNATTESRTWFDDVADWFNSIVRVNAGTGA